MRISIALSLLILAIGALVGWQDHQRLVEVRASHAKLVAEAAGSGISIDPSHPEDGVRVTKRERENKDEDARKAAARFIAFAREMQAAQESGEEPGEDNQKKIIDLMDLMMSLDAAQLKIVIAEIRASKDLKDEMRQGLIGFSIMTSLFALYCKERFGYDAAHVGYLLAYVGLLPHGAAICWLHLHLLLAIAPRALQLEVGLLLLRAEGRWLHLLLAARHGDLLANVGMR